MKDHDALDEQRLRRLIEVGRSLTSKLDLEGILRDVIEAARELTGARYAALGVLDEQRQELERFIHLGIDESVCREIGDLPRGRGVLGELIRDPRPLRLGEVGEHPRSFGFPPGHPPMRTFLGVPIVVRGEAYGNLYLTEKQEGEFDEADEQAATVLSEWAAVAIQNAQSVTEQRLRQSMMTAERERAHWARELHDSTLQGLGSRRVLLASALKRGHGPDLERAARVVAEELGRDIEELRALITELRPATLDQIGLAAALEDLADRVESASGVELKADVAIGGERFDPELETTVYRVTQEALNNVVKHAGATGATLRVGNSDGRIDVVVSDDGVGFESGAGNPGFGLEGMRERVELVGGELRIESSPGSGTRVEATMPLLGLDQAAG